MKKFLLSLLTSAILTTPAAIAMDEADKLKDCTTIPQIEFTPLERSPQLRAIKNISASKEIIHQCLADVNKAELHFFWATGRTLSNNDDYLPDTHVNVGGIEYAQVFFPYVDSLLENSPHHLKINFICDALTQASERVAICLLKERYKERFEILDVNDVTNHLLQNFPTFNDKINTVFKNATQGNPVLPSDIYRIIGMIYGKPMPLGLEHAQHTYCDVDTFCHGMHHKKLKHHIKLIEGLFQKPSIKEKFYFGRNIHNNDLIKIRIDDLSSYKEFCERMLTKLNIEDKTFSYYSNLHDIIKVSETNAEQGFNMYLNFKPMPFERVYIPMSMEGLVPNDFRYRVMRATGPLFVCEDESITYEINGYPLTNAAEWYKHEKDNIIRNKQSVYLPGKNQNLEADIFEIFDDYRHYISLAMYAKRFGVNHPFNVKIKEHLKDTFPYSSGAFKNSLKQNFTYYRNNEGKSYLEWINFLYKYLTVSEKYSTELINAEAYVFNTYFANFMSDLKALGIEIPFTKEHLHWDTNFSEPIESIDRVERLLSGIQNNDINIVHSMLEQQNDGLNGDILKIYGPTIFWTAVEKGNVPIIETLLGTKKIDWSRVLGSDIIKAYNSLNSAIKTKNIDLVKILLSFEGMKWQTENDTVPNILASAIETANLELINLVLSIKNNWAQPQFFGWRSVNNILVMAVDSKNPEIIKSILSIKEIDWSSNPTKFLKDAQGYTLLEIADGTQDTEVMNALFWKDIIDWSSPEVTKGPYRVEAKLSPQMSALLAQARAKRNTDKIR